ncbi:MAG: von Willebrand factor, type [Bryobacterales bacterium]|nr:von Willebrand factor, type [Bryobacterales bacterium]
MLSVTPVFSIRGFCLLVIAAAVCSPVAAVAAGEDVVFRSDVSLVRVDAQVLDRDNRTITGLRASDFVLRENGQPQQIRNFGTENFPVDVVLLLDVSASMRPHVERIASAAHQALRVLKDDDRIAIMVFDRSSRMRLRFRNSREDVEREFESLLNQETFNGGTDITRGILDAADYIVREARPNARRAIVVLTDDQTERNRDVEGVSRALTRADAVLSLLLAPDAMAYGHPGGGRGRRGGGTWPGGSSGGGTWPGAGGPLGGIILGRRGPYGGRGPGGSGGPVMIGGHTHSAGTEEIAHRSGGDTMPVDDASALEMTLARIRQRYALHFNLPAGARPGEERGVEVALADAARQRYPGADVRFRRVYMVPTGTAVASTPAAEPTVVSRQPVTAGDASTGPRLRRRAGVNQDGTREGPLQDTNGSTAEGRQWRTDQSAPQPAPNPSKTTANDPACGGWHRVDEPAPPACPSDTAVQPKANSRTKPDDQP